LVCGGGDGGGDGGGEWWWGGGDGGGDTGGDAGAKGVAPITESIRAHVDVVVAEFNIWELCCVVTALCIDIPIVSAITLFSIASDWEVATPLSSC